MLELFKFHKVIILFYSVTRLSGHDGIILLRRNINQCITLYAVYRHLIQCVYSVFVCGLLIGLDHHYKILVCRILCIAKLAAMRDYFFLLILYNLAYVLVVAGNEI